MRHLIGGEINANINYGAGIHGLAMVTRWLLCYTWAKHHWWRSRYSLLVVVHVI